MRVFRFLLLSTLTCFVGSADTLLYNGTFSADDNVALIHFSTTAALVTMQTVSFADGTNGFEPVLTLYDGAGNLLFVDGTGGAAPGSCGGRAIDPASGGCLDARLQQFLAGGFYTLAVTEWDNIPSGSTLADGFPNAGLGNFTGTNFGCGTGGFFLSDCSQRANTWEVQITGVLPEPGAFQLTGVGILALAAAAWKRSRGRQVPNER
jgi:hypothetical protein